MNLKQAAAVCLISFFSATLVLLIARALDLQAASRLEPQLEQIVAELQALRKQGGIVAGPGGGGKATSMDDGLMVYYFHSNTRCDTCRAIQSQSHETVQSSFASQLDRGEMVWKVLNYEEAAGAELAEGFEIHMPSVVLARMESGQIKDWRRLDRVWALVSDKPAFAEYIRDEISQMLEPADEPDSASPDSEAPDPPLPETDPPEIPLPTPPADTPLPE